MKEPKKPNESRAGETGLSNSRERALGDLETELKEEETDSQPHIVHADPETDEW